ncbi:MAG TPA: hypothetical protein VGK03_03370 [Geothrix sp.]|jgi:hypothetical protein
MLDARLIAYMEQRRIPFCLIGGLALAAWGVARYTADADLLAMDPRILNSGFWSDWKGAPPHITKGDAEDPLGGVVRFPGPPHQDLILGRGAAALIALETHERCEAFSCPVASPLGLILLKLEAGSPQDAADILALLGNAEALGRPSMKEDAASIVPKLTREAQAFWVKISSL